MKELEVKAMLADPNIPDEYKLGGRLDSRFLDGVEYAERAMEKAEEFWVARDKNFQKQARQQSIDYAKIHADVAKGLYLMLASDHEKLFEHAVNAVKAADMFIRTLRQSIWKQQQDNGEQ
jgi:hypothetical protein